MMQHMYNMKNNLAPPPARSLYTIRGPRGRKSISFSYNRKQCGRISTGFAHNRSKVEWTGSRRLLQYGPNNRLYKVFHRIFTVHKFHCVKDHLVAIEVHPHRLKLRSPAVRLHRQETVFDRCLTAFDRCLTAVRPLFDRCLTAV